MGNIAWDIRDYCHADYVTGNCVLLFALFVCLLLLFWYSGHFGEPGWSAEYRLVLVLFCRMMEAVNDWPDNCVLILWNAKKGVKDCESIIPYESLGWTYREPRGVSRAICRRNLRENAVVFGLASFWRQILYMIAFNIFMVCSLSLEWTYCVRDTHF